MLPPGQAYMDVFTASLDCLRPTPRTTPPTADWLLDVAGFFYAFVGGFDLLRALGRGTHHLLR